MKVHQYTSETYTIRTILSDCLQIYQYFSAEGSFLEAIMQNVLRPA